MAEYYGYFNGLEYDEDFVSLVNSILVQNGVFGDGLMVSANSGMTVNAAQGAAIINGFIYYNDSALPLTIQTANATLPRIDSIMLRWDIPNSTMNLIVVTGTAQSNPTAPSPTRNGTYYDMQIATVYVGAGVDSISSANITDTRPNSDVCGITSGYNSVDIDLLMTQYTAQFNDWFEQIKGQLSTDAAGNLQNQINNIPNLIYPVGSIYLSMVNTNPGTLFGGTWQQIAQGQMLVGVNPDDTDFNTAGKTGGEKEHTLTEEELPEITPQVNNGTYKLQWNGTAYGAPNSGTGWRYATTSPNITIKPFGGGQSHNNMPPYIAVYMWKRTA